MPDPRRWWTLAVLCLSLLIIGVDNTILNVALPTLQHELDASASQLQWIVDAYLLVFSGVLLTAGALGDRFGRKRALTLGLIVFGAGSLGAALSGSAAMLIATRALMGVGGALIMPSTLSILTATFPADERGKAIGIWAGFSGLGIAIGPVTGGWLLEHSTWSSIFLVNLPIVAVALIAGRWLVPESKDDSAPRLDVPGFVLSIAGLTALVWALIEAPGRGWTDAGVLGAFAAAAVVLAGFVAWELRAPEPMLDVRLFRNPRFSASSTAISLAFFALFGMIFFLTQYLQDVLGYSALEAGVRTMPVAAGLVLGGPLSAQLAARIGAKRVVSGGLAIVAGALYLLSTADAVDRLWHDRHRARRARLRHGQRDGAGDRRDHGLAAGGQDERRLGRQRHDADGRRDARRRRARVAAVERLPWRHGRRHRRPARAREGCGAGLARRCAGGRGADRRQCR